MTTFEDDPGPAIQAAAMRHLDAVWAAHDAEEENGIEVPSPAVGPFCGCDTCVVRETIAGAWPMIETFFALKLTAGADAPGA